MGFSISVFIGNLEDILADNALNDEERFVLLVNEIAEARQYATDCGLIPKE